MKYIIIGPQLAGNQGAASMIGASIQEITKRDSDAQFTLFSLYPEEDEKFNIYDNLKILPTTTFILGPVLNPLAILYKLLPPFRPLLRKQKHINELAKSDVLLDESGITFVDGREVFLIYNISTVLPGICTNTPVIKCSQAMGPFNSTLNRAVAKVFLPHMKAIFTRGKKTHQFTKKLQLQNTELAADLAFMLTVKAEQKNSAQEILSKYGITKNKKYIAVVPSEVVYKKSLKKDIDYVQITTNFINTLLSEGHNVALIPHSTRFNTEKRHNNDLPLCNEIAAQISNKQFCYINDKLNAQQIRYIIGEMEFVVTSRFHAMISALSTGVPAFIIGWSHKYQEVMDMFGLKNCSVDSSTLSNKSLRENFNRVYNKRQTMVKSIVKHYPAVRKSSETQIDTIVDIAKASRR